MFNTIGKFCLTLAVSGGMVNSALYNERVMHRVVIHVQFPWCTNTDIWDGCGFLSLGYRNSLYFTANLNHEHYSVHHFPVYCEPVS